MSTRSAVLSLTTAVLLAGCNASEVAGGASASPEDDATAVRTAQKFLEERVRPDGSVPMLSATGRPAAASDTPSDTQSDTQAHTLLLAVAVGDRGVFERVWSWTRKHLQRPDGLLATSWAAGRVADPVPAADADVQAAWAVALAAERFDREDYARQARRLAESVMQREVGLDRLARPALAAGPWGVRPEGPTTIAPGRLAPPAHTALRALTGDPRWEDLTAAGLEHLRILTRDGRTLPPDWALVGQGYPRPTTAPDGTTPRHTEEAMPSAVWTSCTAIGRALVARSWPLLRSDAAAAPRARRLDGAALDTLPSAHAAVSAAAVARAAGEEAHVGRLLSRADALAQLSGEAGTQAWVALGRLLLNTDRLAKCG